MQSDLYDEAKLLEVASAADLEAFNQLILVYQSMAYHRKISQPISIHADARQ